MINLTQVSLRAYFAHHPGFSVEEPPSVKETLGGHITEKTLNDVSDSLESIARPSVIQDRLNTHVYSNDSFILSSKKDALNPLCLIKQIIAYYSQIGFSLRYNEKGTLNMTLDRASDGNEKHLVGLSISPYSNGAYWIIEKSTCIRYWGHPRET